MAAVVSVICTLALGVMLPALLARYFVPAAAREWKFVSDRYRLKDREKAPIEKVLLYALALFLLSRALIALTALISALITGDMSRLDIFSWVKWDANHYVSLAEDWYVNEGDPRYHIVFFPLYPAILRLGKLLFGWSARVFGIVFSNVCLIASGVFLYRLAEAEYGPSRARLASALLMFSPVAFFFSLPFSESLFFLLSVSCAYFAAQKKFVWAVILGALASATRMLGLLCAVAVFYGFIRGRSGLRPREYLKYVLLTCLVATGFLAYLLLNYRVTGAPFTFLIYQREHWSQTMGSVGNTVRYTLANALNYDDINLRLGTWIPQFLSILLSISLLCLSFRRVSPADGAYALLYIWFALSPTWLLSGARYVCAMYPLYLLSAALFRSKFAARAALALSACALCYMSAMYMSGSVM